MEKYSKKRHIFEAAAVLFYKKGYAATSMRELATEVRLEVSSLYSHIKSKEQILQKVCFDVLTDLDQSVEKVYANTQNPKKKLRSVIYLHVDYIVSNAINYKVFRREYRNLNDQNLAEFLSLKKTYEKKCISIIKEGIRTGDFRDIDPNFIFQTLIGSISWVDTWHKPHKGISLKSIQKNTFKILMTGIKK